MKAKKGAKGEGEAKREKLCCILSGRNCAALRQCVCVCASVLEARVCLCVSNKC